MPWKLILGAATLATLLFANQVWLDYAYAGLRLSWWRALAISAGEWYLWAALTPAIVSLGRRRPVGGRTWLRGLAVHLPASVVVAAIKTIADQAVAAGLTEASSVPAPSLKLFLALLTYWAILGGAAAHRQSQQRRERDMRAAQLEADLARAHLESLKTKLHPHFLFNTLNSISALMREDVEAADLMLTRLSDLLRMTLDRASRQTVTLKDELELTSVYLAIQEARLGHRLTVGIDVGQEALPLEVPSLLLQPLVENAFRHGVAARPGPARVGIRVERSSSALTIEVTDNGPGPTCNWQPGVGLSTTRARLRHLYGDRATLALDTGRQGGATARVTIPIEGADR